jgi:hypothetical protein
VLQVRVQVDGQQRGHVMGVGRAAEAEGGDCVRASHAGLLGRWLPEQQRSNALAALSIYMILLSFVRVKANVCTGGWL